MKLNFLFFLALVCTQCTSYIQATSDYQSTSKPHASITCWNPGILGSANILAQSSELRKQQDQLPIWVTISFDKPVSSEFYMDFYNEFCKKLRHSLNDSHISKPTESNQLPKGLYLQFLKNHFIITVARTTNRADVQTGVDSTNRHFDPEFKTPEEIAIEQARAEEIRRLKEAEELAAQQERIAKAKELKQQAEEKEATERKARKEKEAAELKAKAAAEAEKIARLKKIEAEALFLRLKEQERQRLLAEAMELAEEEKREACHPGYTIIALPENFSTGPYQSFNNHGQVAGYMYGIANAKAAFWDPIKGLILLQQEASRSFAYILNDNGFICISCYESSNPREAHIGLWNINTNKRNPNGPTGDPYFMNQANKVLFTTNTGMKILWNPQDNTVTEVSRDILRIGDDEKLFNFAGNKNGARLNKVGYDHTLFHNGENHLCLPPEGHLVCDSPLLLNDNDEVVALIEINNSYAITKWQRNNQVTRSKIFKIMPELKGFCNFRLKGFNNKGQILLQASSNMSNANMRLFLLTPMA